jgi:Protein of unknown function (DUF3563)
MRLTAPMYEGDSMIRSGPAFSADVVPAAAETAAEVAPKPVEPRSDGVFELNVVEIEARARAMRAAYLSAMMGRLWDRFEAWLESGRRARDEAYLARAANLSDLEMRMRKLERDGYVAHL